MTPQLEYVYGRLCAALHGDNDRRMQIVMREMARCGTFDRLSPSIVCK